MERLKNAIMQFSEIFMSNKQNLGKVTFRDTYPIVFPDEIAHSKELDLLYSCLELCDGPTIGGDFFLEMIIPSEMKKIHEGWRWIFTDNGQKEDPEWNKAWTIFADRHGDVLIADTSKAETPVIGSIQGNTFQVSDSLAEFFEVIIEGILLEEKYDGDTRVEDMSYKPEYMEEVAMMVQGKLSKKNAEGFLTFFFG